MSIALLKTFIAVADVGSFRGAADKVHVTPAAVGHQMKQLELLVGHALFDRSDIRPKLSSLGHQFVGQARDVVQAYDALMDRVPLGDDFAGEFALGAVSSTLLSMIPQAVNKLVQRFPNLKVRIVPGLSDDLQEQVDSGRLDAAVLSPSFGIDATQAWVPMAEEELVMIAAPDVVGDDAVALLNQLPFIRHTRRSAVGILADAWLRDHGIAVAPVMEMESLAALSNMVSHGLGVSIVPNMCVPGDVFAGLRKLPLGPERRARVLGVLTRKDSAKAQVVKALQDEITATIAQADVKSFFT
ncbi:MAG: LysR substrate-binding domain-containing protein [Planktomarina sp.]